MPLTSRRSRSSSGASNRAARYARSAAYESPASRAAPASASRAASCHSTLSGESPGAFGREPGGVRPPPLVPVCERHRAEHVFRRLGGARAFENVRRLAGSTCPLEHHRQVEPYAVVGGRRLRQRPERRDGRVVLAAPRRLDRGLRASGRQRRRRCRRAGSPPITHTSTRRVHVTTRGEF